MIPDWLPQLVVGCAIGIIAFFLKRADDAQGKQITELWSQLNKAAEKITELRERLARLEANKRGE